MAEQEQNRSEAATPFKLREAKKRGSVAKSMDLNSVFIVSAFLVCMHLWIGSAGRRHAGLDALLFLQSSAFRFSQQQAWAWLSAAVLETVALMLPVFGVIAVAAVLGALVQHGPVLSVQPVKPDFKRLNPATGFKRLFSKRTLFDLLKSILKLLVLGWVLYLTVVAMLPAQVMLLHIDVHAYAGRMLNDVADVVFKLLLALLGLALVDLLYTRWEYADKLRMSRRELKDEIKQREGDPKIKGRIRELQNELRKKSRALRNLPDADVLVTNPTHLAVALMYRHGKMGAPAVVAKGSGDLVERMKVVARRHRVTIVENRRLAQALHRLDIHDAVPEQHYAEVARILIWVQQARHGRTKASAAAAGAGAA